MRIEIRPIGFVHSDRKDAVDDNWGSVHSYIELADDIPTESIDGLLDFSHVEIIYHFHKVQPESIIVKSEHPRENPEYPKVGIFAQRKKARPNRLGLTVAHLDSIDGRKIYLSRFDGIDGTPVIDIKPLYIEYLPADPAAIKQPPWVTELMKQYW